MPDNNQDATAAPKQSRFRQPLELSGCVTVVGIMHRESIGNMMASTPLNNLCWQLNRSAITEYPAHERRVPTPLSE